MYENPWISVREDSVIKPGGSRGIFGVVTMLPGVTVVPVDGEGNVTLIREFKYAVGRETLEAISGGIDGDETPLEAAKRELREECGLEAEEWKDFGTIDPFTTVVNSPNHLFLARILKEGPSAPDAGELLRALKVPFAEAYRMVLRGEITHGASCVAILKIFDFLRTTRDS